MLTLLVVIGWLITIVGLSATIIMQVWVQPRWFREDSQRQAKLITDRFDAQLKALETLSQHAAETVEKAAGFFQTAEHEFESLKQRLAAVEHTQREEISLRHRMVRELESWKERLATLEGMCTGKHGESIKLIAEHRRRSRAVDDGDGAEDDEDTGGIPRKRGGC